jgi:dynein heavy chain
MPSLSIVLLQEMQKFNNLLKVLKKTLQLLKQAIQGLVTMSQDLDLMYVAFTNNQLPANWRKVSFASLKPLNSWFKDMIKRVAFF